MEINAILRQVAFITHEMDERELREWLYDYARKLSEVERGILYRHF